MGQQASSDMTSGPKKAVSPRSVLGGAESAPAGSGTPGKGSEDPAAGRQEEREEEDSSDVSFNYNSESSEEDNTFPTSAALVLADANVADPIVDIDVNLKRVAKDWIGSTAQ